MNQNIQFILRITVKGQRAELSTKRCIERDNWDSKANKAKGYKSEIKQLNQYFESLKALMNDYHTEMIKLGEEISAQNVKNKFPGISEDRRHFHSPLNTASSSFSFT